MKHLCETIFTNTDISNMVIWRRRKSPFETPFLSAHELGNMVIDPVLRPIYEGAKKFPNGVVAEEQLRLLSGVYVLIHRVHPRESFDILGAVNGNPTLFEFSPGKSSDDLETLAARVEKSSWGEFHFLFMLDRSRKQTFYKISEQDFEAVVNLYKKIEKKSK